VQTDEVDTQRAEFLQGIHELPQAAGKPVIAVDNDGINQALPAVDHESVKSRTAFPRSTDAFVYVFLPNLEVSSFTVLTQLAELHFGVLTDQSRNSRIQGNTGNGFHGALLLSLYIAPRK